MAHTHPSGGPVDRSPLHHEESDIQIGPIFKFLGWLTVLGVAIQIVVWFLMGYLESQAARQQIQYPLAVGQADRLPPEPRLQTEPRQDLGAYDARERELLDGYQWIDKSAGVVRIPVEQAMKRVVEQGIPTRNTQAGGARP